MSVVRHWIKEISPIFKYNENAKYSAKVLKCAYTGNDFLVLNIYLHKQELSTKIQLLNIFKDHHIVARSYSNEWPLSNALRTKLCNYHCKYKAEWREYFQMCWIKLNVPMFCATSALVFHGNNLITQICLNTCFSVSCVFSCINDTTSFEVSFTAWRWF